MNISLNSTSLPLPLHANWNQAFLRLSFLLGNVRHTYCGPAEKWRWRLNSCIDPNRNVCNDSNCCSVPRVSLMRMYFGYKMAISPTSVRVYSNHLPTIRTTIWRRRGRCCKAHNHGLIISNGNRYNISSGLRIAHGRSTYLPSSRGPRVGVGGVGQLPCPSRITQSAARLKHCSC